MVLAWTFMNETALLAQTALIGLGAWRLASLFVNERGPYDAFLRFRTLLGYTHDSEGKPETWPGGWREIFSCIWCCSIYSAIFMWGLWELEPLIVVVWAAAGAAIIIEQWNNK